jgi:MalK OB fold domain
VAGCLGDPPMSLLTARLEVDDDGTWIVLGRHRLRMAGTPSGPLRTKVGEPVVVGARPEHITPGAANPGADTRSGTRIELVVIELKRTDDGGHMDLQAIRYAAMVSSLTFADVATAFAAHCAKHRPKEDVDARGELAAFLDQADGTEEGAISSEMRIILVSADFGREITTTVLWLNGFEGMDIR